MEVELGPGASASATLERPSSSSSSSLGWPFGLSSTCIAIHAPSPKGEQCRRAQAQPSTSSSPVLASFQQQFVNLQSTFLLPFFSDVGESSSSDSEEMRSEAASSFFKDSRRITLGSLIGLPMDNSFHHFDGAQYFHVDDLATTTTPRRSLQLPSCAGILELLRCGRPFSNPNSFGNLSDHDGEITAVNDTTTTLAAFLQVELTTRNSVYDDVACVVDDTLSTSSSSHSPDWNDQFVSCHSVLSAEAHPLASSSPKASSTPSQNSNRMQRSASMKSFFSSICCRIDTVHRP